MPEGNLLTLEQLKAQSRAKRRRMTLTQRADDDRRKAQLLNRRLPRFEALLDRCFAIPTATATRRRHRQAGCQTRARSVRRDAPARTRGSRRVSSRSTGSSGDDPGGESEPPGLGNTGRQAYSRKLSGVVA
jgi:hypothetical protein